MNMVDAMTGLIRIEKQLDALFIHDQYNRLQQPRLGRVPDSSYSAPRFFISRTTTGNIWRYRDDMGARLLDELEPLAAAVPPFAGPGTELPQVAAIRTKLEKSEPIKSFCCGPAFYFPQQIDTPDNISEITPQNTDLLQPHFADSIDQFAATAPLYAALQDGVAVCTCESVRVFGGVHEAGLATVESYRGQGLAPRVTSAWAQAVRRLGDEPLYSTSWDNAASRRVAEKLGLITYGENLHFS